MAAFSTSADWSFPSQIPGGWQHETEHKTSTGRAKQSFQSKDSVKDEDANRTKTASSEQHNWPPRQCRICLDVVQPSFDLSENTSLPAMLQAKPKVQYVSEDGGRLLRPCKCKGTQKYVHEECLAAWRLADPLQKRNYWECPTCRYRYRLERLTWASYISSTASQIGLTLAILVLTMFLLGFIADPIINLYLDPVYTITTLGGTSTTKIIDDEPSSWIEHFAKGLASLGLLGFAKFLFTLNPFNVFNIRVGGFGGVVRGGVGGSGRDRMNQIGWIAIVVGVLTFLYAVWKAVRAWSRRTLEAAGERVLDVNGDDKDDGDHTEQTTGHDKTNDND